MKQGDFTLLAKEYIHRTGYSIHVLEALAKYMGALQKPNFIVADVGAGTGKLTENLIEIGLHGYAIEPNSSMREEGLCLTNNSPFQWLEGSGEATSLPDSSVDWVLMGSSFHWTNQPIALKEFRRILKPGGFFTAIWNPRDLEKNPLHKKIESKIHQIVPTLQRASSGAAVYTKDLDQILLQSGDFKNLIFIEAPHEVVMSPDRYLGAWRSVNDIQAQAGPQKFKEILSAIQAEISHSQSIYVPYRTRAWTVQSTKAI